MPNETRARLVFEMRPTRAQRRQRRGSKRPTPWTQLKEKLIQESRERARDRGSGRLHRNNCGCTTGSQTQCRFSHSQSPSGDLGRTLSKVHTQTIPAGLLMELGKLQSDAPMQSGNIEIPAGGRR